MLANLDYHLVVVGYHSRLGIYSSKELGRTQLFFGRVGEEAAGRLGLF
jgi:hypothetical protein